MPAPAAVTFFDMEEVCHAVHGEDSPRADQEKI